MIVQTAGPDGRHLVLTMDQHTATGKVMAQHFGETDHFERPEPSELFIALVAEHDHGWAPIDAMAPRDPDTNLPWNVWTAPLAHTLQAGTRSIDHNEACHPYRGLLSSMHIVGLFTGRFGVGDPRSLDDLDSKQQARMRANWEAEEDRRKRLRTQLASDPKTRAWVDDGAVMRNYKVLQFFDRFALWLQVHHPTRRQATVFDHVPASKTDDFSITVEPLDATRVRVTPFPFDSEGLMVPITGRSISPQPADIDLATALKQAPTESQPVELVA